MRMRGDHRLHDYACDWLKHDRIDPDGAFGGEAVLHVQVYERERAKSSRLPGLGRERAPLTAGRPAAIGLGVKQAGSDRRSLGATLLTLPDRMRGGTRLVTWMPT
jgi:hypothetical protein